MLEFSAEGLLGDRYFSGGAYVIRKKFFLRIRGFDFSQKILIFFDAHLAGRQTETAKTSEITYTLPLPTPLKYQFKAALPSRDHTIPRGL